MTLAQIFACVSIFFALVAVFAAYMAWRASR